MIHNNHLVTPQKLTDSTGTVVWSADYKPFGEATVTISTITNNLRFPGQYFDAETGLNYNYYRDYNPVIGRYVESDPLGIEEGTNHMYSYVENKPLNYIDRDGLSVATCCGMTSKLPKQEVMTGLECMSRCLKTTILISSGWRDEKGNEAAGGVEDSYHLKGLAADVHEPPAQGKLRKAAAECGLTILAKKYPNRIHVEVRDGSAPKKDPDERVCKKIRESGGSSGSW
jgi:RHS repeat-associated protein